MSGINVATVEWRKSSFSGPTGQCVEVASTDDTVAIRDSKSPHSPALVVAPGQWRTFVGRVRTGHIHRS
jgi:hypothetical protein